MKLQIKWKDYIAMYSNLTIDDRHAPLTLTKDNQFLSDLTDESKGTMESKFSHSERIRS